jgi:hypothetical protein
MRNLAREATILKTKGFVTHRGADNRLKRFNGFDFLSVIIQREDGTFVPCAILGEKSMWLARNLAEKGILVTTVQ